MTEEAYHAWDAARVARPPRGRLSQRWVPVLVTDGVQSRASTSGGAG